MLPEEVMFRDDKEGRLVAIINSSDDPVLIKPASEPSIIIIDAPSTPSREYYEGIPLSQVFDRQVIITDKDRLKREFEDRAVLQQSRLYYFGLGLAPLTIEQLQTVADLQTEIHPQDVRTLRVEWKIVYQKVAVPFFGFTPINIPYFNVKKSEISDRVEQLIFKNGELILESTQVPVLVSLACVPTFHEVQSDVSLGEVRQSLENTAKRFKYHAYMIGGSEILTDAYLSKDKPEFYHRYHTKQTEEFRHKKPFTKTKPEVNYATKAYPVMFFHILKTN